MDFIKENFEYTKEESLESVLQIKKIPGTADRKTIIVRCILGLIIAYSVYAMYQIIDWLVKYGDAAPGGERAKMIFFLVLWIGMDLLYLYWIFFMEKRKIRKWCERTWPQTALPRTFALKDGVFSRTTEEDVHVRKLKADGTVYFTSGFVYYTEKEGKRTVIYWTIPRRAFDTPSVEQAFREHCSRYCAVKDV